MKICSEIVGCIVVFNSMVKFFVKFSSVLEQERLITAVKCLKQELSGKEAEKREQMEQEGLTKHTYSQKSAVVFF